MTELRRNPQLGTWVMVSAGRQHRPQMPKDGCPFCPGSGQVPEEYDVFLYANDFPHLMEHPPEPEYSAHDLYPTQPAYGHCDVVLYSPDHRGSITRLSPAHRLRLFDLWRNRVVEMKNKDYVKYCYIFENKGEIIGVTMPHPHGQIYSYPFIPLRLERELHIAEEYYRKTKNHLFDEMIQLELEERSRLIHESKYFVLATPFAGDYPYETHIFCKPPRLDLTELSSTEADDFMRLLQDTVKMYDALFGFELPFMMAFHQAPVDGGDYSYYRFHVEFYPMHRAADRLKFNAGSETGAWAFTNPSCPEEKAEELRAVMAKILNPGR